MKRLRVILLFLQLGAVVNVGVAWGFHVRMIHETYQILNSRVTVKPGHGGQGYSESTTGYMDSIEEIDIPYYVGWPMMSLQADSSDIWSTDAPNSIHAGILLRNVPESISFYGEIRLPIQPTGLGFLTNTVFYAALSWLLITGMFGLRRLIRRKRGLCVKCAYDLRGVEHEACPECGTGVRKVKPA